MSAPGGLGPVSLSWSNLLHRVLVMIKVGRGPVCCSELLEKNSGIKRFKITNKQIKTDLVVN